MSWKRSRPNGGKTAQKYRDPEHVRTRRRYEQQLAIYGSLTCAQPVCVMPSRIILPGMRWCGGHDDTGTAYIGPVHERCNVKDAAKRARARQSTTRLRW